MTTEPFTSVFMGARVRVFFFLLCVVKETMSKRRRSWDVIDPRPLKRHCISDLRGTTAATQSHHPSSRGVNAIVAPWHAGGQLNKCAQRLTLTASNN